KATYGLTLGQFHAELNPLGIIPQVTFNNITNPANITYDGRTPLRGADTLITFTDNITYTLGSHNFKAGFYAERARNYEGATAVLGRQIPFLHRPNNPLKSWLGFSNPPLGNLPAFPQTALPPRRRGRQSLAEWFIQDSWKATRRWSFEYGVRF